MARSNNVIRPLYKRFLVIAIIILFIIAVIVISIAVPVTLTKRHNDNTVQSIVDQAPAFNVTYLFPDESSRSTNEINFDTIDRIKMARSFERSLSLNIENILNIRQIYSSTAISSNSKSRRKRFVQCDNQNSNNMSGPVLIFDFNLIYPTNQTCRSQACINDIFNKVYQQFKSIRSLSIDFNNISKVLNLCSFGVTSSAAAGPPISIPQNFTTPSSTTRTTAIVTTARAPATTTLPAPVATTTATRAPPAPGPAIITTASGVSSTIRPDTNVSSSSTTGISSTIRPDANISSSTTVVTSTDISVGNISLSATGASSTSIPDMNITSTMSSSPVTTVLSITETISSNLTLNETNVSRDVCLQKIPITQEQVPPYRITHTSTLFFQDNHSLVVVGASKFETLVDIQTIERQIIINGEMVYTNCQRTIEISLPMIYHSSI